VGNFKRKSEKELKMSRFGVLALLVIFIIVQMVASEATADEPAPAPAIASNPYNRPSHFNMEMYRLAAVGAFLGVAAIIGVVVYKTCSWPRLV